DVPRIAKTEVVTENPGDEKSLLGRMVDKINPFSSSSPAPAKETEKKAPAANAKAVSPQNSQLIGSIDEKLQRRAVDAGAQAKTDPLAPKPDLPQIAEAPLPPKPDQSATLSAIDGKALASASGKSAPVDPGTLISNIDSKLKRQGIDPAVEDVKIATPVVEKPIVTPKPKAAPEKALEPRLPEEKSPLFLAPQDVRVQEKPADVASTPAEKTAAPVAPSLPELAVKGPPQLGKDKPADTKIASKGKSPAEEEDVENKSAFDQIKEDIGRIGKILN